MQIISVCSSIKSSTFPRNVTSSIAPATNMQAFVTIVVLFIACGLVSARDDRLSDDCLNGVSDRNLCCDGVPDAWFAHLKNPSNCSQFYQCANSVPVLMNCSIGLHWSVAEDRCEWPDKANCIAAPGPTSLPTDPTTPPTDSTTSNGGSSTPGGSKLPPGCYDGSIDAATCCVGVSDFWVHLPDPENCGKFYQCDNGKAVHKDCPAGLHWSVSADQCDWPNIAGCTGNTPSTTTRPSSTVTPSTTTGASSTVTPSTTTGPSSTVTPSTTTEPSSPVTPPTTPGPLPGDDVCAPEPVCHQCLTGIFPADLCCRDVKTYYKLQLANGDDCSSYYQCVDGKAILRPCPSGLHWSVDTDRCEHPDVAQCGSGGVGSTTDVGVTPTTPTPGDGTTSGGDHGVSVDCLNGNVSAEQCCKGVPYWVDVLLQNNADCHTYIQCVHEKPMVRPCPAGLWWSVTNNRCEWIENATCTW